MSRIEKVKDALNIKEHVELPLFVDLEIGEEVPKNTHGQTVFYLIDGNEK